MEIDKMVEVLNFIDSGMINNKPHGFYISYINQIHNYFLDIEAIGFEKRNKILTHCNELLAREMLVHEIGQKELNEDVNDSCVEK